MTPTGLPPAVPAPLRWLDTGAGRVAVYHAGPPPGQGDGRPPLLLVHSVNAAASAAEVAPLFNHHRVARHVVALDLPGYGHSDRSDRPYNPRLMTDAVLAVVDWMREELQVGLVDALGVSLGSEFVARAQSEAPASIRRIALVSPTGFSRRDRRHGPPGTTLVKPWLLRLLSRPGWGDRIFRLLTKPGVVRYFLKRTFGSSAIDETLWRQAVINARQPGAHHAPLSFLSGALFSADVNTLYESLTCPVWVSMSTRGDFTDYQGRDSVEARPNWQFHAMEGGALPYFEDLPTFTAALDPFWR
ncbi:MAG: alpha/beta fold hydrolase [Hydrogenophaga sp.]|uniref:alpha/beta fold hydrolase n=1 Tax=Hydrogenophaga sp. TaxID=1904254 RepID=UPI003D0E8F82